MLPLGSKIIFNTIDTKYLKFNGKKGRVESRLPKEEVDIEEVGPMYHIVIDNQTIEAFADELTLIKE